MNKPNLPEEKIQKLLICLFTQFASKHDEQTHKLSSYNFYLTDMIGCAKSSGLNYSKQVQARDGEIVQVGASQLVDAVKELEHRGYVQFDKDSRLTYTLTATGYEKAKELSTPKPKFLPSLWEKVKNPERIADGTHKGIYAFIGVVFMWLMSKLFS